MKRKKSFRKIYRTAVGICLIFCMAVTTLFVPTSAAGETSYPINHDSPYYLKLASIDKFTADTFTQYMYGQILQYNTQISLPTAIVVPRYYTENGDTKSTIQDIYNWLFYDCPAFFHLTNLGYNKVAKRKGVECITNITIEYTLTADAYAAQMQACDRAAASLLKGIQGNDNLSNAEKALLLHDRLAILCGYDQENVLARSVPHEDYVMYGALVNHKAVCEGYALAYQYLLSKVGIFSYICASDEINHAWNVVYIDGIPYHVDVTHDDPLIDEYEPPFNMPGRVFHQYFLMTDAEYRAMQDVSITYTVTLPQPLTDTRYRNAYWRDLDKEILLINDEMYYCRIDENYSDECALLKKVEVSAGEEDIVHEFEFLSPLREVNGSEVEFWEDYPYPMPDLLSSGAYKGYFLYSQPDGIYGYHLASETSRKFCGAPMANNLHEPDYFYVFGCSDGDISYDVYATQLTNVPETGGYNFGMWCVSAQTRTVTLFDVNEDDSFNIVDLIKAKKMAVANQSRFIEGCGQVGDANSLALIQQALLEL